MRLSTSEIVDGEPLAGGFAALAVLATQVDFPLLKVQVPGMEKREGPLELPNDPIQAFQTWLGEAITARLPEPMAMTLATASVKGRPSARIVLFKGMSRGGFAFFTNYDSAKAVELEENPWAALVFHWYPLGRQVRIEGQVERLSPAESDDYFRTRPRGSQIGAWSSPQSQAIQGRATLLDLARRTHERFEGKEVPRPANWGGYRVAPQRMEFWEARDFRLHERLVYERDGGSWRTHRLAP